MARVIGKGSYGCVVKPALGCPRGEKRGVSKLFDTAGHYHSEMKLYKTVAKKIDPHHTFTVRMLDACQVPAKRVSHHALRYCGEPFDTLSHLWQIAYEDGGDDLSKVARGQLAKQVMRDMGPIFEGLVTLKQHGMAHLDIKTKNVVYNIPTRRMRMIDFGLMRASRAVYLPTHLLASQYVYYPPEFTLFDRLLYMVRRKPRMLHVWYEEGVPHKELKKWGSNYKLFYKYFNVDDASRTWSGATRNALHYRQAVVGMESVYRMVYETSIRPHQSKEGRIKAVCAWFAARADRIDVYMMGLMMFELAIKSGQKTIFKKALPFIQHMTDINVEKRWTPEKARDMYLAAAF